MTNNVIVLLPQSDISDRQAVLQAAATEAEYMADNDNSRRAFESACRWLQQQPLDVWMLLESGALSITERRERASDWFTGAIVMLGIAVLTFASFSVWGG